MLKTCNFPAQTAFPPLSLPPPPLSLSPTPPFSLSLCQKCAMHQDNLESQCQANQKCMRIIPIALYNLHLSAWESFISLLFQLLCES